MKLVKVYRTLRKSDDKTALKYKIPYSSFFVLYWCQIKQYTVK